jgi:predicted NBD/HSP70 family sugar kinase
MTAALHAGDRVARPAVLAFDIGGTWVKHGLVDAAGVVHQAGQLPTRGAGDGAALLAQLVEVARPLVHWHDPAGIAFATLGIVEPDSGRVQGGVEAIPGYAGQSPKALFETAFGRPVVVENDGNSVALAEGWTGSAAGLRHYLALTLGTGIGGGIVVDGRLHRGANGAAGEWGYMRVDGKVWEDHASLRGLAAAAEVARPGCRFDARAVFAAADAGDAQMREVLARWFDLLATGIANLLFAFDPARLIVGGGITARGDVFIAELQRALAPHLGPDFHGHVDLALATAGNDAGLIGAARLWLTQHGAVRKSL